MSQAIKGNKTDGFAQAGPAGGRGESGRAGVSIGRQTVLLTSGGRLLHRISVLLWILALLCFVLAAFVWWELLHV